MALQKERFNLIYKNVSDRYRLGKDDCVNFHKRQFIFIYRMRICLLKDRIINNARKILGNPNIAATVIDCQKSNQNVLIVGSVFKKMKFRQSVLYEFADDSNLHVKFSKDSNANLTDDEDLLELENSQQIFKLVGNIDKHNFVTGDVIGVFGYQEQMKDVFNVEKIIFPELPNQIPWPILERDCYVAFISGISLTGDMAKSVKTFIALDAFQKWINGEMLPECEEECNIVQNIVRLVIAGDFARINPIEIERQKIAAIGLEYETDSDCLDQCDRFFTRLLQNIPVDVMPGSNDPSQCMIPQQPIPRQLFEAADKFPPMLNPVTNPYLFMADGLLFLGTSGQNINDLGRLTRNMCSLDRMERTLKMGHLFPTVPDTLAGFPFEKREPLILHELPHVYFCGNQATFEKKIINLDTCVNNTDVKRCLLLTIPKFCETFEVIVLNLRTLHTQTYSFNLNLDFELPAVQIATMEIS